MNQLELDLIEAIKAHAISEKAFNDNSEDSKGINWKRFRMERDKDTMDYYMSEMKKEATSIAGNEIYLKS